MIFALKMPEFYVIIARKIFSRILGGGARAPLPPPVSYAYAFVHNEIYIGSYVVTYLIFEFSFIMSHLHVCVCIVHNTVYEMHYYFLLNIKHGASQLYLRTKIQL